MNPFYLFLLVTHTMRFHLPHVLDVFPELRLPWPRWSYRNNRRIPCKKDSDCPFPATCCVHPFLPGGKQCCTGFGQRIPVKKYILNTIPTNT